MGGENLDMHNVLLVACRGYRLCAITYTEYQLVCKGRRMMRGSSLRGDNDGSWC